MTQPQGSWPRPTPAATGGGGYPGSSGMFPANPSGLFPGPPPRPVYREEHPITAAPLMAGIGSTLLWLALFGALARDLAGYAWWTLIATVTAWAVAAVLTVLGDRGVATGIAITAGFGLSVASTFVAMRWITTDNWPLW